MNNLQRRPKSRSLAKWWMGFGFVAIVLIVGCVVAGPALSSVARAKIRSTLQDRFNSDLQIQHLQVPYFHRLRSAGIPWSFVRRDVPAIHR